VRAKAGRATPTPGTAATGTWSATVHRSASAGTPPFRSARSGALLPGNRPIRTPIVALGVLVAPSPIEVACRPLICRVAPIGLAAIFASVEPATISRLLLVRAVVSPAHAAIFKSLVLAPTVIVPAPARASRPTGGAGHPAAIASRSTVFRARIAAIPVVVCRQRDFVSSKFTGLNLVHRIDSPLSLSDELHHRCGRNPSKKHQRVIAHRHFLDTPNAGRFSESTRSPILKPVPHPRPMDVSRPRLRAKIRDATLTEDEPAQRFLPNRRSLIAWLKDR